MYEKSQMKKEAAGMTLEKLKKCGPRWLNVFTTTKLLEEIGKRKERWTALDVINLREKEVSAEDKLWAVLRPEFIDPPLLHEFACRCAEKALELVGNPDPRSVAAVEAKRRWLKEEITDEELRCVGINAFLAIDGGAERNVQTAAWAAVYASVKDITPSSVWKAANNAAWTASYGDVRPTPEKTARDIVWDRQLQMLREMLEE